MPSVETIYQESVKPLPLNDQLRLAEIIVKRAGMASVSRRSAVDILNGLKTPKTSRTADEIDKTLRMERDSWDG